MVIPDSMNDKVEALGWNRYEIDVPSDFIEETASIVEKLFGKVEPLQIRVVDRNGQTCVSMRTPRNLHTKFRRIDWTIKVLGNFFPVHARAAFKRCRGCNGIYDLKKHCYIVSRSLKLSKR